MGDRRVARRKIGSRRVPAIAFLGDRQADDVDARIRELGQKRLRVFGCDEQCTQRTDNPYVLAFGASDTEHVEPVLGRQCVAHGGRVQIDPANCPITFARCKPIVENDRLMGAMEGPDAEAVVRDAKVIEVYLGALP